MIAVVLGAGRMGAAAASDFAAQPDVDEVVIADRDAARAAAVAEATGRKARAMTLDLADGAAVGRVLRGASVALSASTYTLNVALARAAIEAGCHFVDLGGNNDVVRATLALDGAARAARVRVVPDCGLAPGMAVLLAARLAARLERCDQLRIRVGGLPLDRPGPLEYRLVFSVEGLINEYKEPCLVVRDGTTQTVEPLTEVENVEFPAPFGVLECFHTSGGLSTLPDTLAGRVPSMDYKTIRYPGHARLMKAMLDLGFADEEPLRVAGRRIRARSLFEALLERALAGAGEDAVLVRVEARGELKGKDVTLRNEIVDRHDAESGLSAMARTTAFPATVVALELARDRVEGHGARPAETWIDLDRFVAEVRARGIAVEESSD